MNVMLRQSFSRERATQKYLAARKTIRAEFVKAQEGEGEEDEDDAAYDYNAIIAELRQQLEDDDSILLSDALDNLRRSNTTEILIQVHGNMTDLTDTISLVSSTRKRGGSDEVRSG